MKCKLCKIVKSSITYNNYNYCLSCFMSADSRTLLEENQQKTPGTKKRRLGATIGDLEKTTPA